jgi:3-hydroxybutyrate dehydrogenase
MTKSLSGRVALITGSTSGIGEGIAQRLAEAGCDTVLHGLGVPADVENARDSLAVRTGARVTYYPDDLNSGSACRAMVQRIEQDFGAIDILINNAGIQHVAPVEDFPADRWDAILAINLSAPFHLTAAVLPGMRSRGFGRIINIASAHGLVGSPHKAAYVASKHGLVGLTKVVALETAESAITCNAICPGYVSTPLIQEQIDNIARERSLERGEAQYELLHSKHPTARFTTVSDIANLVYFLCGPNASNLTGAAIPIDGGWTSQ